MPSILVALVLMIAASDTQATEEPAWSLLETLDEVELRLYEPSIEARTPMTNAQETSSGFRRLAGYIFGGNDAGTEIAMTAPVSETLVDSEPTMAFTMPSAYRMDDLPAPDDDSVSLHAVPERTIAVIRFSGWATDAKVERYRINLLNTLAAEGIDIVGEPALYQYNPPWTPPFLRRNEVAVEVKLTGGT
ncbi:MAG: heme-binding protein [Pseudomonadota bacterium]